MGLRTLARTIAHNKSYNNCRTTDLFQWYFSKAWREKGHPANARKARCPGPTKKGHRPLCPSGKER